MTRGLRRAGAVMTAAVVFGVAIAVLKGGGAGMRDSIGNVSAPWLLLPYFAGTATRRWWHGAVLGSITCCAALLGFYVAEAFVLDLGPHSVLADLALTVGAGRMYFTAGLVCGPLLGAIGGKASRQRSVVTAAIVGLSLVCEPVAVFAWLRSVGVAAADSGMVTRYPVLWIGEMALGTLLSVGILVQNMIYRHRVPAATGGSPSTR